MAQTREDRVYLAFRVYKMHFVKQGSLTPRAHAILEVCARFNMSVEDVKNIVNARIDRKSLP